MKNKGVHNNNRKIEKELAKVYSKRDRKKNRILIVAVALAVFLLYSAFSIANGKIRSDYLLDLRGAGTAATISLEDGNERQYNEMKKLPELSDIGIKKNAGDGTSSQGWHGALVYLDKTAYLDLTKPAFTDIKGNYPKSENEIMLPARILTQMKIDQPKIGMPINLEVELKNGVKESKKFLLSGYYRDYITRPDKQDEAFISEDFLKEMKLPLFPVNKILAVHDSLSTESFVIQKKIEHKIVKEYDAQRMGFENPKRMQGMKKAFGGFSVIIASGIMVIICAWLLVFNVVSISLGKDIRQYGLLKVLGATNGQLKRIIYRQKLKSIASGLLLGGITGVALVKLFLPKVSSNLYMKGVGINDVSSFYPLYLIGSVLFVFLTAFFATGIALRKVIKWNAVDSIQYVETDMTRKKEVKPANNFTISRLAWRNVTRSKKRLFISMATLLLGGITALSAIVITTGTDQTNKLKQNSDFLASYFWTPTALNKVIPQIINDETAIMPKTVVDELLATNGVEKSKSKVIEGTFAMLDYSKDSSLQAKKKAIERTIKAAPDIPDKDEMTSGKGFATLQIIDEEYVDKLAAYAKKVKAPVDIEALRNGTGAVLIQNGEFSEKLNEKVSQTLGKPIHFYSLSANRQDNTGEFERGKLVSAGAVDRKDEYWPILEGVPFTDTMSYFILTEKAFQKLNFPKKYFAVGLNTEERKQATAEQLLTQIIQQENKHSKKLFDDPHVPDNFEIKTFAGRYEQEKTTIETANIMMTVVSLIILLIGVMNFANTLVTSFSTRNKEFAIMESIGLTRKQLLKMSLMEGAYYWLILMLSLLTIGSGCILVLGNVIKEKLVYFEFIYPWRAIILSAAVLLGICFVLSLTMYLRGRKLNLTERLRQYTD